MRSYYFTLALLLATIAHAQTELTGFPISYTRSSSDSNLLRERGPVIANVDDDIQLELIVLSDTSPNDGRSNRILVFDPLSPNSPEYTFDMPANLIADTFAFCNAPAVLDGNENGIMEIAVGAWKQTDYGIGVGCPYGTTNCAHWGNFSACTHVPSRLLVYEIGNPSPFITPNLHTKLTLPSVGDVTGDGIDDIVFVGRDADGWIDNLGDSWGNTIIAYSWNLQAGNWQQSFATTLGYCHRSNFRESRTVYESSVALGDIWNNDGVDEVVALLPDTTSEGGAVLFVIQKYPVYAEQLTRLEGKFTLDSYPTGRQAGYPGPILGDVIEDGVLDAAFVVLDVVDDLSSQQLAIYNGATGQVQYINIPDGFEFSSRDLLALANGPTAANRLDIYVPTRSDTLFRMQWLQWDQFLNAQFVTPEQLLDWPKDFGIGEASPEVGYAPAISTTNVGGALELISQFGLNIWQLKLNNAEGGDTFLAAEDNINASNPYYGTSTVADVNGDGEAELVVTVDAVNTSGRIHAFELNVAPNPAKTEWTGLLNGPKHTGLYAQPVSGTQVATTARWSGRVTVRSSYTVPTGSTLTIEAGTVVLVEGGADFTVSGRLNIIGNAAQHITIRAKDAGERWNGIKIAGGSVVMDYVDLHDFRDYGVYTDTPVTPVTINHVNFDCANLREAGVGLMLWNSPTVTQSVKNSHVHSLPADSQATGMYLQNCKVNFDTVTIEDCDWVNSYIKKVTGSFHACTFKDRVEYYAVFFNSTPNTPNFRCCQFLDLAPTPSSAWPTTIYCAAGTMPSFGAEGNTGGTGVSNVIQDFSNYLLTMNGSVNLPIIDSYDPAQLTTNGGHNDWIQQNTGGKFFLRNSPGTTTYPCTEQYWSPSPTLSRFYPQTATLWNYSLNRATPWGLCGGGSGGGVDSYDDGPLVRDASGELDDLNFDSLYAAAAQFEDAEDYAAAQELFKYVVENASLPTQRWNALAHVVVCESFTLAGSSWAPELISDLITREESYEARVLGERLRASYHQNREEYEQAIETCVTLLGSGLTYDDSIQVAIDLVGIQMSMQSGGGSLDGAGASMIPATLKARDDEHAMEIERDLLAVLNPRVEKESHTANVPREFKLYPNHPNPFNPSTQIEFDIPDALPVTLKVFNSLGQEVTTVVDRTLNAGHHTLAWDGKTSGGNDVATGVYVYQIKAGEFMDAKKMVLIR